MFEKGTSLKSAVGSAFYVAPQVLEGDYDEASDLWSLGCIMFVMLSGQPPFLADTEEQVLRKVKRGYFQFKGEWAGVSEDAKNLITELLEMDPSKRITSAQALKHTWILDTAPNATGEVSSSVAENLISFQKATRLKKAALQIIASNVDEKAITQLRDAFIALDVDGDGVLTAEELKTCLAGSMQNIPDDIQKLAQELDVDGSGGIDYTEFIAAALDMKMYTQEEACWKAFTALDKDGNGQITAEELKQALHSDELGETAADMMEIIADVDSNGDGQISFEEFLGMMRRDAQDEDIDVSVGPRLRASRRDLVRTTRCCGWC